MTDIHTDLVALCIWREARGEGPDGMHAVANVIMNRAVRHHMTPTQVVMTPLAFSSMTAHGDPQLSVYPVKSNPSYVIASKLAGSLLTTPDITKGATLYYDDSISFPHSWNREAVVATVKIGRLNFFREL
jgi:spore germination cell wall hydrolase CwlJ-like protein